MKLKSTHIILTALLLLVVGVAMLAQASFAPSAEGNTPAIAIFTAPTAPYVTVVAPVYPTPEAVVTPSPFATVPAPQCAIVTPGNDQEQSCINIGE